MSSELLPCPFCGGEARKVSFAPMGYSVCCLDCGVDMSEFSTEEAAIDAWNTRAELTCKNVARNRFYEFECSLCGFSQEEYNDYGNYVTFDRWEYCPNCGSKVIRNAD